MEPTRPAVSGREPVLNVPAVILALILAFVAVHVLFWMVLPEREATAFLLRFAFIPARYDPAAIPSGILPGGSGADIWTFVTYAFLHADFSHLFFNSVWLLAFGSPVARRFGTQRFLVFFAVTAAAGAALHLAVHPGDFVPVVGASAAISGAMAAALRFVFHGGGPLGLLRPGLDGGSYAVPAQPLRENLRDSRVLLFVTVWFGVNIVFGLGGIGVQEEGQTVAWIAHIGGFAAGLLLFPMFDPVGRD
ncbi:MAG TPA: rhomboid family intramembrane serine protease [Xanthobacteraceae bacterium]|nr:rhomboid family intramembrane serine protease [Xanthobacteraceae bacterium]